jgi:hypothetical protein
MRGLKYQTASGIMYCPCLSTGNTDFHIVFFGNLTHFRSDSAAWHVGLEILLLVAEVIKHTVTRYKLDW